MSRRRADLHGEELGYRDEFKPASQKSIERLWHRIDGLGVEIMGKDDSTGCGSGNDAVCDDGCAGAFPIERIDRPQNGRVTEFIEDELALALKEPTIGRTHRAWADTGSAPDGIPAALHFQTQLRVTQFGEQAMGLRMISDLVTFCNRAPQHARVKVHVVPDHIERGFDVSLGKHIQQPRSIDRMRAIVVGDRDMVSGYHHTCEGNA